MIDNLVIVRGNLTRDPERRVTSSGLAVANFTVAVNEEWKGKDGSDQQRTTFVNCTAWKGMADKVTENFSKGGTVLVQGRLSTESWEKEGKKYSKLVVTAEVITSPFFGTRKTQPAPRGQGEFEQGSLSTPSNIEKPLGDDDVPF